MASYFFGCGFNGFHQLSNLLCLNKEGKLNRELQLDNNVKIISPTLLMDLSHKDDLLQVVITWSVTGVTLKRKENGVFSFVTKTLDSHKLGQIFEKCEFITTTGSDILLWMPQCKQYSILKEHSGKAESLNINDLPVDETAILCGAHHDFFVTVGTNFGKLTNSSCKPKNVESLQNHVNFDHIASIIAVRQISCGKEHVLLLGENGCILSYGNGSKGQLGHSTVESITLPTEIEALLGLNIAGISAGGWHSAAITVSGDLYMWGWNESGQLGVSCDNHLAHDNCISNIETEPVCITFSGDCDIATVVCGSRHSVVLNVSGEIYSTGWNEYGQLGLGDTVNRRTFTKLQIANNMICVKIFAGWWNTFYVFQS